MNWLWGSPSRYICNQAIFSEQDLKYKWISVSVFYYIYTHLIILTQLHSSFKPPLVPVSLSTGNNFLKNWQYDVTCTFPAWCGLMYHKSPRDLTPRWVQLLLFPEIRSTSNYFYILSDLGSETSFCCAKKGNGNPTEIMLGLAGGMKVNCYLKIIYLQLQEWSTHRYD